MHTHLITPLYMEDFRGFYKYAEIFLKDINIPYMKNIRYIRHLQDLLVFHIYYLANDFYI